MKKIMSYYEKKGFALLGILGLLAVAVAALPYLLLGQNFIASWHDQLDGEVIGYMMKAKYLFSSTEVYPEMMNGIPVNGLFPPAPLVTLFYVIFKPFTAYMVNQIVCMLVGFVGMYLCISKSTKNHLIAAIVGVLFAYIPMFSVYGFCQYGQPLLFFALYELYQNRHRVACLCYIVLFGFMSSLVLIGYAILGFAVLFILYQLIRRKWKEHIWFSVGTLALLAVYALIDYKLILQIFSVGKQVVTHKEALEKNAIPFADSFREVFYEGTLHAGTHQQVIVILGTVFILFSLFLYWKRSAALQRFYRLLYLFYGCILVFSLFYATIHSCLIAGLRNHVGGIVKTFQLDRVYWLSNSLWYFVLALCLFLLWEEVKLQHQNGRRIAMCLCAGYLAVFTLFSAAIVYYYSDFNKNVHRLVYGECYPQLTWSDYYAPDVFGEIRDYIGRDQSEYRTLSLGICPAAPIYNGFYCLDGYSNNYSLDYMKEFRGIIVGELEKDPKLMKYYDKWGCRCYLLSAELGIDHYMLGKENQVRIQDLDLNMEKAGEMGAEYLFSAIKLDNPEELSLKLMREEPFATPTSYYGVYLYQIG